MKYIGQGFQKLEVEQMEETDRCDRMHYQAAHYFASARNQAEI